MASQSAPLSRHRGADFCCPRRRCPTERYDLELIRSFGGKAAFTTLPGPLRLPTPFRACRKELTAGRSCPEHERLISIVCTTAKSWPYGCDVVSITTWAIVLLIIVRTASAAPSLWSDHDRLKNVVRLAALGSAIAWSGTVWAQPLTENPSKEGVQRETSESSRSRPRRRHLPNSLDASKSRFKHKQREAQRPDPPRLTREP